MREHHTRRRGRRPGGSPNPPNRRPALLGQCAAAFENSDAAALEGLLRKDAMLEMTPSPTWFADDNAIT